MSAANFIHGWMARTGSIAIIAIILIAFGIMLGIVKPADALSRVGAVLGIVVALVVLPGILASAWSAIPLWQRLALAAIALGIWLWRQSR